MAHQPCAGYALAPVLLQLRGCVKAIGSSGRNGRGAVAARVETLLRQANKRWGNWREANTSRCCH
jgi:hypothetical protein